MNAVNLNQEVINAFEKRNIGLLEQLLDSYPVRTLAEKRFAAHFNAKKNLINGELELSLNQLKDAVNEFGPHVGILSDIVAIAYLLNDLHQINHFTEKLEKELLESKLKLASESLVRSFIFLGKIKEFNGEVYNALELYQEAFEHAESNHLFLKAAAQIIRLKSFLGKHNEVSELYSAITLRKLTLDDNDFELNHSALLVELRLFGMSAFTSRMNKIIDENLPEYDKRQMVCHYLEELIWQDEKSDANFLNKIKNVLQFDDLNTYEYLVLSQFIELPVTELQSCLSPLDELKRLILQIKLTKNTKERDSYKKMFFFQLQTLSKESRMMLEKKWIKHLENKQATIHVSLSKNEIYFENKIIEKVNTKQLLKLITYFENKKVVSTDDIATELFESDNYNENEYHRLRMIVSRLNKSVRESTGISKLFVLKFSELKLDSNIVILFE